MLPNEEATPRYLEHVGEYFAPEGYEWKTPVAVDTTDYGRFPKSARIFEGKVELCIDHHGSNTGFAEKTLTIPEKASCGEIIFEIIKELCGGITPQEAGFCILRCQRTPAAFYTLTLPPTRSKLRRSS